MPFIRAFRDYYSPAHSDLRLHNFPIYIDRIQHIQRKMNERRPQRFRELWVRPYKDPLAFYGFFFAVIIGLVGIVGLAATVIQTYASVKGLRLQMQQ